MHLSRWCKEAEQLSLPGLLDVWSQPCSTLQISAPPHIPHALSGLINTSTGHPNSLSVSGPELTCNHPGPLVCTAQLSACLSVCLSLSSHHTMVPPQGRGVECQSTGRRLLSLGRVSLPRAERDEGLSNQELVFPVEVNHSLPTETAGRRLGAPSDEVHLPMHCISATLICTGTAIVWRTVKVCEKSQSSPKVQK